MANTLELLLIARDQFSAPMQKYGAALGMISKQADEAATHVEAAGNRASKFGDAAKKIDAAGRNANIGLRSMSQAAQMVGVDISGITSVAAGASDAIGDMAGALESFGAVAGVVGVAVIAISLIAQKLQAQHDATVQTVLATDSYLQSMSALTAGNAEAAASIQKIADLMVTQREMASSNPFTEIFGSINAAKTQIDDFFAGLDAGVVRFRSLGDIIKATTAELNTQAFLHASDDIEKLRDSAGYAGGALYGLGTAMREAASAAAQAAIDTEAYYTNLMKVQGASNLHFYNLVQENHALDLHASALDANNARADAYQKLMGQRYPISMGAAKDANEAWLKSLGDTSAYDAAKAAAQRLNDAIKGFVENAVAVPSFEEHLKRIADGGKDAYENLFRLDAVATGTNPAEYGAGFEALAAQLEGMGYSAAQAAAGIRDFSIFAEHPELVTSGLIDMGAVVEDVKNQLLGMAGKANVVKEAMRQVWASLDPKQKADLAAAGIDDASEAVTALLDPTGQAKGAVDGLNNALGAIPRAITSTITVIWEAAKTAIDEFRTVLDQFIADYQSISISINAEATTSSGGGTNSGGTTTNEGTGGGYGGNFATGLDWTVPSGFPNDTYPFRGNLTSGEHVRITPAGQSGVTPPPTIIIYVDGERVRGSRVRMLENHGMFPA